MPNPGIEILDAVKDLLELSYPGIVERQIVPITYTEQLTANKIVVAFDGKETHELDRTGDALYYNVFVGVYQPMSSIHDQAEQATKVDYFEAVQDIIADVDNRQLTLATTGIARLHLPFTTPLLFSEDELKSSSTFFSIANFRYRYYKTR